MRTRPPGDGRQKGNFIAIREHRVIGRELAIHRDAQAAGKCFERWLRRHQQRSQRDDPCAIR
jgi:hypothetical protein